MNGFWTETEAAFRRRAADYFRNPQGPIPSRTARGPAAVWEDLEGALAAEGSFPPPDRLNGRVSICEQAACHDPRLGHDVISWRAVSAEPPPDPIEQKACRLGGLAGTASYVLEAGSRAARERGSFSSSLMGCREVQENLAGLVAGAELARLGACRLCRLLEKGDRDRAGREAEQLDVLAARLEAAVRAVALALLGERWVAANLFADDPPLDHERTSR